LEEAEACYQQVLAVQPKHADALHLRGVVAHQAGRHDLAIELMRQALKQNPRNPVYFCNLGSALKDQGKREEAIAAYRQAISIKPDYANAHSNLGSALQEQGKREEAIAAYRQAISIKPDYADAHYNLGSALQEQGKLADAVVSFERALALKPTTLEYACRAKLLLPIIPSSANAIELQRMRYQAGISILTALPGTLDPPRKALSSVSFNLAYHNADDRPLMEALCRLFRTKVPALTFVAPHVQDWQPPTNGRRIRVAFLSEFLVFHTIGKLYQGFIRHLDRTRFEVVVIHAPKAKRDPFAAQLDGLADKALKLPVYLAAQQQAVAAEKLDILFLPDIGMSSATYFLAYSRLAPIQAVSWGHPDTTGLDTLDYFVSAETIEPPEADLHYSERLIRLSRLPCCYQPLIAPTTIPTRVALGLPETGTLYGCPQAIFKFHPEFDAVLAEIAAGDPDGYIVVLDYPTMATWSDLLRQRWAQSYPILLERVIFLSHQPLDRFMALMAHFDVLLDPIHFGSGNTLYEAMVYGTPIVTWPGRFMRGRIVAGAYRQMRLADAPIVQRREHYAPLALALGRDPVRRGTLRQASLRAASELFADMRAVREFEAFLIAAVEATGHGEKLPVGWRPAAHEKALT
jgi:predicted O-linked N-acetylglucosamine transferase (SPINDLY family)